MVITLGVAAAAQTGKILLAERVEAEQILMQHLTQVAAGEGDTTAYQADLVATAAQASLSSAMQFKGE